MKVNPTFVKIRDWIISLLDWIKSFKKPVANFLPGQVAFLVNGSSDINVSEILDWANGLATTWSVDHKYEQSVEILMRRLISFPLENNGFTVIFTDVTEIKSSADLLNLILYLDNKRENVDAPSTLRALSPNWLVSGSPSDPGGTGGPGSWPVEAQPVKGEGWRFQSKDRQNNITPFLSSDEIEDDENEGDDRDRYGDGIHIAILDTMPIKLSMRKAYQEWRWHHRVVNNINTILPGNQTHIERAEFENLYKTVDSRIVGHPYLMRDHGLFVASIIHTLAPKATLHLYEVLNPYGVGSLLSILESLKNIVEDIQSNKIKRPIIVNCSFTLMPPPDGMNDPDLQDYWDSIMDLIEEMLKLDDVIIVAAAGNDAKYNNPHTHRRSHASYPAAFDNVVGVGALPKGFPRTRNGRFRVTSYSNLADEPQTDGYVTLGGEAGPGNGILGMYISDYFPKPTGYLWRLWSILTLGRARYGQCYPPKFLWDFIRVKYKPNTTGWAWWAGTSFAAAIFSGSLASLYTAGDISRNTSFDVPSIMAGILQTEKSVDDENVLLIEQR